MGRQLAGIYLVAGEAQAAPAGAGPARMLTRLSARLRGRALDRALRAGADPASSAMLAQRAAWLTTRRHRRKLARSLHGLLDPVTVRGGPSAAIAPHRGELARARLPLARLAALLEIDEPVYARGVAMAELLLTQGDSHLYVPERAGQLRSEVEAIVDALEGREDTW